MTISSATPAPAGAAGIPDAAALPGHDGLQGGRAAPRLPASLVPTITGIRILPADVVATLVNISTSGMLVECNDRLTLGSEVTVSFDGSFTPRTVRCRVARASVSGIGSDGSLRYHIGLAFAAPIALPAPAAPGGETPAPTEPAAPPAVRQETLRNRW